MIPQVLIDKPYVVEFEHAGGLFSFVFDKRREAEVRAALSHNQCKAIICSSKAARKTLKELFAQEFPKIKSKTHIIYPALDRVFENSVPRKGIGDHQQLKLLYVGNDSCRKGLEEILIAIEKLNPSLKQQINLTVISNDAGKILKKYPAVNDLVKILPPGYSKQEIIDKFYKQADLFLLPTKQDTFGFSLLDALSCGTPVIATKQFAIPEVITNNVDGQLLELSRSVLDEGVYFDQEQAKQVNSSNVDSKLVDEIIHTLTGLCQHRQKIKAMSANTDKKFKAGGRFNINTRNEQLLDIYKRAIT